MVDRIEEIRERIKEWHNAPLDERQYTAYARHTRLMDDLEFFVKLVDLMNPEIIKRVQDAYLDAAPDMPLTLTSEQVDDLAVVVAYARRLCRVG